ncbi:DUF3301 domain-containing protein [Luteimonas sp. S4-F44]|uniref:DUF3301 domain-containing protein n=1 Tax=Luteimonas sp. S4-F44 TaxID=2925842 RepID=UPI001F538A65|nr:DUF3301 domain-containing protein [Luteimonas sp. S4-F44]UNK41660.1 DUF3301 domain-containing protein [Luteimonas sp. S4-F44]
MPDFPTMIFAMLAAFAAFLWWSAARGAAERAGQLGREACERAGVQWLDQSVHAYAMRLRRDDSGRLRVERSFRFEYSEDGIERHVGQLVLRGERLVAFSGPTRRDVATLH